MIDNPRTKAWQLFDEMLLAKKDGNDEAMLSIANELLHFISSDTFVSDMGAEDTDDVHEILDKTSIESLEDAKKTLKSSFKSDICRYSGPTYSR